MHIKGKRNIFDFICYSDRKQISSVVDSIVTAVRTSGINLSIIEDELLLAVDEAVTNAMEHGNKWDPSKKVWIKAEVDDEWLVINIIDEGEGFNYSDYTEQLTNRDRLSSRGRGLVIIGQLCDLCWNNKGNHITLSVRLAA